MIDGRSEDEILQTRLRELSIRGKARVKDWFGVKPQDKITSEIAPGAACFAGDLQASGHVT